jgi:hypothetical protein
MSELVAMTVSARLTIRDKPFIEIRSPPFLLLRTLGLLELLLELLAKLEHLTISTLEKGVNNEDEDVKNDIYR